MSAFVVAVILTLFSVSFSTKIICMFQVFPVGTTFSRLGSDIIFLQNSRGVPIVLNTQK